MAIKNLFLFFLYFFAMFLSLKIKDAEQSEKEDNKKDRSPFGFNL